MAQFETEFCIGTLEGCRIAECLGATRVELCSALSVGGLTPSLGMIRQARQLCHDTKLHVLIRPRDGDFLYNKDELAVIVEDIKLAREAGANGVAVGCLNPDGTVDLDAMQQIIAVAGDMAITFHRAFDVCADQVQAFQELLKLGRISRILTSGGYPTAMEGVEQLKLLQQQAQGTSLAIMAASGVNEKNVVQIAEQRFCLPQSGNRSCYCNCHSGGGKGVFCAGLRLHKASLCEPCAHAQAVLRRRGCAGW